MGHEEVSVYRSQVELIKKKVDICPDVISGSLTTKSDC